jgi:hypothetical protein
MDRQLMLKIIGGFRDGVYKVTPETAECRHHQRMIMLVRWTFLRYCQRRDLVKVWLDDFGHNLMHARIGMWMDEPYMKLRDNDGQNVILAQLSINTLKALYYFIKNLDMTHDDKKRLVIQKLKDFDLPYTDKEIDELISEYWFPCCTAEANVNEIVLQHQYNIS